MTASGRFARLFAISAFALIALAVAPPPEAGRGVVATDHALASEAGAEMLRQGGNAVDAAVAAALAAGVVQPAGSGLGGGGFALVVEARGGGAPDARVLDFREVAPAAATRDMFRTADGGVHPTASTKGGLAVAVPAESRGLWKLHAERGRLPARTVAEPAVRLASGGFRIGPHLAKSLAGSKDGEIHALFAIGDRIAAEGDVVRREALGRTLRQWVSTKGEALHSGAGARAIAAEVEAAGGVLTTDDLAAYAPEERDPIVLTYRGYTIVTMPPPSSGGVLLGQMLKVLEGYDVAALGHGSSDHLHLLAEVMKHAYADRARYLGDPAFLDVPVEHLLSDERVGEIRRAIWPGRTFARDHYGPPIEPHRDAGTQHVSVVDREGLAVALTTTINTTFGSGLVVEDLGVVLNNQMDDFSAAPGVPNAYGLVGNEGNAVAAGKRPLSSMSPTVLIGPDGEVVAAVGASGGAQIITAVLQVVSNVVDFGMDAQEAVAAPRVHHQWVPDRLVLDPGIPLDVQQALAARGHEVVVQEHYSSAQIVTATGSLRHGGADPRKGGWAAGAW